MSVCCSVLQCVAVCCSVLPSVTVHCCVKQQWVCGWVDEQRVAVCCSVLQCAAVFCSVLQCNAVCYRVCNPLCCCVKPMMDVSMGG